MILDIVSGAPATQSSTTAEEAFVVAHHELGLDLGHGIHCYADEDQQRRAAKIELITHSGRDPGEARSRTDESVQRRADKRQPPHFEPAQHELRNERYEREVDRADS